MKRLLLCLLLSALCLASSPVNLAFAAEIQERNFSKEREAYERRAREYAELAKKKAKAKQPQERETVEEDLLEDKLDAWAEQHAKSWEKWAERFEERMEKWAEETEEELEDWAEGYSKKWEKWSEQIEDGLDEEQLRTLLEKNMKMIGDLPLGALTERLEELGHEFEEMPLESLGELSELLAGSLENSLHEYERALKNGDVERQSREMMGTILKQLHGSIDARQNLHKKKAKDRIKELNHILRTSEFESIEEIEELIEKFQKDQTQQMMDRDRANYLSRQRETLESLENKRMNLEAAAEQLAAKTKELDSSDASSRQKRLLKSALEKLTKQLTEIREAEEKVRHNMNAAQEKVAKELWRQSVKKKSSKQQQSSALAAHKEEVEMLSKAQDQALIESLQKAKAINRDRDRALHLQHEQLELLENKRMNLEAAAEQLAAKAKNLGSSDENSRQKRALENGLEKLMKQVKDIRRAEEKVRQNIDATQTLAKEKANATTVELWRQAMQKSAEQRHSRAMEAQKQAAEMMRQAMMKKAEEKAKAAADKRIEAEAKQQAKNDKSASKQEPEKLKRAYLQLLEKTERIEAKEAQLDEMRREIESLRRELEAIRKKKSDRD